MKKMNEAIATHRKELSPYAPRIYTLKIDPEKIRDVIGRGGEMINKIIDECGGRDVTKETVKQIFRQLNQREVSGKFIDLKPELLQ